MDSTIRSLVRFVARGFYGQQYVLILDAILLHSVLSEDDLLFLLGIQRKNLRSLCNKLVEDRMLTVHSQKEELPNLRLTTRTYYYIHITEAIDSIKWKMHSVVKLIMDEMKHDGNPQGYVCPRCKSRYSQLDAISMLSDDRVNFVCDVCQGILIEDDSGIQARKRQEKLTKLMNQIDPIIGYLKKIDDSFIEDNTFESTLTKAIPAQSTPVAAYAVSTRTSGTRTNSTNNMSASLQSAAQRSQATLHVRITANDENALKESQEKTKRQEKMKQNALPSWHSESTVGKASLGRLDDEEENESAPEVKVEEESSPEVKVESTADSSSRPAESTVPSAARDQEAEDALADYYARLAAENAEEEEDDDDDDEDDDDEFEEVEDFDDVSTPQTAVSVSQAADDDDDDEDDFDDFEDVALSDATPMVSTEPTIGDDGLIEVEEFDGESDEE